MCQISTLIAGAFQNFLGASCERRSLRVFSVVIPKQFLNNLPVVKGEVFGFFSVVIPKQFLNNLAI